MSVSEQPLISENVRDVLNSMAMPVTYPKNTVLFTQGDAPIGVYIIRKGSIRLTIKVGESEVLMRVAQTGSVLGLPGVLSNKPYSLTARVVHPCELGFVNAEKVIELVRRDPSLGLQVLQLLSEEVRTARSAMANSKQTPKT